MQITRELFGHTKAGEPVELFRLTNNGGAFAEIITYGGAVRALTVPDQTGALGDVVLGYDTVAEYEQNGGYLGALIGRVGNRIEQGRFTLNSTEYQLACNDGNNHLHGGMAGFDRKLWSPHVDGDRLELSYVSPDGEEHYPGNLRVVVCYAFSEDNALTIDYTAVSDRDTVVNLTNHSYFNLVGQGSGTILAHQLRLPCERYTENNAECVPTGVIAPVAGTPMDFTGWHAIGERIHDDFLQLRSFGGYDHNFILNHSGEGLVLAAELWEPASGRLMQTYTTKPGLQLYTGNGLPEGGAGKSGARYQPHAGLCLETQFYPNAMKHKNFPSPILRAGETYHHTTVYLFSLQTSAEEASREK